MKYSSSSAMRSSSSAISSNRLRPVTSNTSSATRLMRRALHDKTTFRLLLLFAAGLLLQHPCASAPFTFNYTGSLSTARSGYTATLLQNGKVLVAGGQDSSGVLSSAELYDPATGKWTA